MKISQQTIIEYKNKIQYCADTSKLNLLILYWIIIG